MQKFDRDRPRARGIYLLPNLFTTAGLFGGFYAIIMATEGHFSQAAIAIFIAMIADGLDGRVARLTHTQSAFGTEYDSLSDMVAFGAAPSILMYMYALQPLGRLGWLAAFIYTAATALRLARFNVQTGSQDKRYFQGLASPAAAANLAGFVWAAHEFGLSGHLWKGLSCILTISIALLMVSNIRYHSFKQIDLKGRVPFLTIITVVLLYGLISLDPPQVLFFGFFAYALSGPLLTVINRRKVLSLRKHPKRD